jgi:hypothetical protein
MAYPLTVPFALLLVGCAAAPTVEYRRITDASQLKGDELDTYAFRRTLVRIESVDDAGGCATKELNFEVQLAEEPAFKIAMRRADKPGVRSNLNISKVPNTDLVDEVGSEVADTRVELINTAGGIVAKLASFVDEGKSAACKPLLVTLNMQELMDKHGVGAGAQTGVAAGDGVDVDFGPLPVDAKPVTAFPDGQTQHGFFYAACRTATVRFKHCQRKIDRVVKVSDARYFQRVGLPEKGKVIMHPQCGASVISDKDTGIRSNAEIVDALVTQAKAIKDAIEAARQN